MKKRIMIIAPQFEPIPLDGGGVEGLITDLINENELQRKCDFFVISKEDSRREKTVYKNTTIFYSFSCFKRASGIQKKAFIKYLFIRFFRKLIYNKFTHPLLKNSKFGFEEFIFFGFLCKEFYKRISPDAVIIFGYDKIHHFWPIIKKYGNFNVFYHLHYCRAENLKLRHLIPNSIATSDYVFNKWNKTTIDGERSVVIHHGVDLKKFNYNFEPSAISDKRKSLGIKNDDFVVIFAGRFRPGKGVIPLLKAFELIKNDRIKLLMAGEFDSERHKGEEVFEDEVNNLIASNKNVIRLGFIPNSELSLYYACANAQVAPTIYEEAAGLVTIEGMLAGLPIIITKSGGMPEYVDDRCSFKLEIDDNLSNNIAKAVIKLFDDPKLCKNMSDISRKSALEFSISNYYNKLVGFLLDGSNE